VRKRKLLFALAGAGAGNFTRVTAILEELDKDRFDIAFVAQGRSRQLAPPGFPLFPLLDVTYGAREFTAWNILSRNWSFPLRYLSNRRLAARALDEFKPDLLVVDSDFYCFPAARRRGIPIISINSSPATIALFRKMDLSAANMLFSYYCVEKVDCWLQRRHADRIICPVLESVETGIAKVQQVPPIVRRQFRDGVEEGTSRALYDIAVMLGGSGIGASSIDLSGVTGSMVVLGAPDGRYPPWAVQLPFTAEPAAYLSRARILVIQAGLNSISEAIALKKPAVVVPIPNHAEQFVNACCAQQLGIGVKASGAQAGAAARRLLEAYDTALGACRALSLPCDGATRAAQLIEVMASA